MTTAHLSSVPTFGDFDLDDAGHLVDEAPRTTFTMVARLQRGAKTLKRTYPLTAYAETDAGSLLVMLGGQSDDVARQFRGIQAFMMRALVDDDGVPLTAVPRLLSDDDLTDDTPAEIEDGDDVELAQVPADGVLARMGKAALVALATDHDVDTDGLDKGALVAALAEYRDRPDDEPVSDLAVIDGDEVVDAKWRLVFPDLTLADDAEFDTLVAAQDHAATNPSSRRLFFDVTGDPEQKVSFEALQAIVGHIAGKAAGRPTKPSAGSSRSRAKKARRGRT